MKIRGVENPHFRQALGLALGLALTASCSAQNEEKRVKVERPGLPIATATEQDLSQFAEGDGLFEATFRESDGLGPLYVRDACAACHQGDGRGPGTVTKLGLAPGSSRAEEVLPFGTSVRPFMAAGAKLALLAPSRPEIRASIRLPPAVWGRGYLEAVSPAEIERLATTASTRGTAIRGRIHRLGNGAIGRFGLKARLATLHDFTADALQGDMGITSPSYPKEPAGPEGLEDDKKPGVDLGASQVELIASYVRLLAIPPRAEQSKRGAELFAQAQCATCHVPALRTSRDFAVKALSDIDAPVYTDFLLHDMGERLSDGVREGDAGAREWRTAPLLGLRFTPSFLHDGRAKNVRDAILEHGDPSSEARESVAVFQGLAAAEQDELVRFVEAL